MHEAEFRILIGEPHKAHYDNVVAKHGMPVLMVFQFHMIGQINDYSKWFQRHLQTHNVFPHKAVKVQLAWSKKAREEREAPWQHMFGCLDWLFCMLLNVGLWLEVFHVPVLDR